MKTKIFILFSLCLGLVTCTDNKPAIDPDPNEKDKDSIIHSGGGGGYVYFWGNGEVHVLQFKEPEYKEYILTDISFDGTYWTCNRFHTGPTLPIEVYDVYHKSPYIDLVDNYVLLDWKNYHIIYEMVSKYDDKYDDIAIIKNKWEEFDDFEKEWPLENLYVKDPWKKMYTLKVDTLNYYNNGLENPHLSEIVQCVLTMKEWEHDHFAPYYEEELEYGAKIDNAYAEYKEVLIKMINDGVLEDYAAHTYEKRIR